MESHADNSITTEGHDENSSKEKQSSMTSENSSEEDLDSWQKYSKSCDSNVFQNNESKEKPLQNL